MYFMLIYNSLIIRSLLLPKLFPHQQLREFHVEVNQDSFSIQYLTVRFKFPY